MTTTKTTRKITASVGPKLMDNADKFFNGSTATILDELIQNSRRAGATEIKFIRDGADLMIVDNGAGLPSDKADVLLQFGGSANDTALDIRENAAGIGFFCLSRHLVQVRSHDWSMKITPAAFRQKEPVILEDGLTNLPGMTLKIVAILPLNDEKVATWRAAITNRILYSGLTAVLENFDPENPHSVETVQPKDFLDSHTGLNETSFELPGLKIKIVREKSSGSASYRDRHQIHLNFYGQTIAIDTDVHTDLKPGFPADETYYDFSKTEDSYIETINLMNAVYIDVFDTSALQLKLPDRTDIIANTSLNFIRDAIDAAFASMLRINGLRNGIPHDAPFRAKYEIPHVTVRIDRAGENFGVRQSILVTHNKLAPNKPILLDSNGKPVDPATIIAATDGNFLKVYAALLPDNHEDFYSYADFSKAGYTDTVPRLNEVSLIIVDSDNEFEVAPFPLPHYCSGLDLTDEFPEEFDLAEFTDRPLDSLFLRLHYENRPNAPTLTIPIPCFAIAPNYERDECDILVAKDASVRHCVAMLTDLIDWYVDDCEWGSTDDQEANFRNAIEHRLTLILKDPDEYRVESIKEAVREVLWQNSLDKGSSKTFTLTISTDATGHSSVEIVELAAQLAQAA